MSEALSLEPGMAKTSVSILIPVFNAQEWIADTPCSAIRQARERREIIVVDDSSTDQTLAIARFGSNGPGACPWESTEPCSLCNPVCFPFQSGP